MSSAKRDIQAKLRAKYGKDPLDVLMEFATGKDGETPEHRLEGAKAAAPFVHPKLKQVEVHDDRQPETDPSVIERQIAEFLAGRGIDPAEQGGHRDLIGDASGATEGETGELH